MSRNNPTRGKHHVLTQNQIFSANRDKYFKNKKPLSEYDFISCLSITYAEFRNIRKTTVNYEGKIELIDGVSAVYDARSILGVFPVCDAVLEDNCQISPRFLKKFSNADIGVSSVNSYFRVKNRELSRGFKNLNTIETKKILSSLNFIDWTLLLFKIFKYVSFKKYFLAGSFPRKITILRSLLLFEINFLYFSKKNMNFLDRYEKLYITNFYSPENLGLIKAFIESGREVWELQHGVQKNVAGYEQKHLIPDSIKPHKFLTWFDNQVADVSSKTVDPYHLQSIEDLLRRGSGLNIIITLQPSNSDQFLKSLNLLELTHHSVKVRPHPRRRFSESELRQFLNFDFVFDSSADIDLSLINMDLHLTEYSSCVLDALNSQIPSVCFHSLAFNYFEDLLNCGGVRVYSSVEEFLAGEKVDSISY